MLKSCLLAAVFALSVNAAEAAQFAWFGTFKIVGTGAGCAGSFTGATAIARIRPANIGDNGDGTRFAIHAGRSSQSFRLQPGAFNRTFKKVDHMSIGVGHGASEVNVLVKFSSIAPAFSQTARFVNVVGAIRGWEDDADCVVTFNMGLLPES